MIRGSSGIDASRVTDIVDVGLAYAGDLEVVRITICRLMDGTLL